jgi:hypothetical protein
MQIMGAIVEVHFIVVGDYQTKPNPLPGHGGTGKLFPKNNLP